MLIQKYFLFFFTVSLLGWCMEVCVQLYNRHRFINRGFLIGPYCPIYGFGAVLVTALLSRLSAHIAAVFFLSMLICGALEYLTSYIMEKLFHARWWDYSKKRFNLSGRVCAGTLIPFGALSLLTLYGLKPLFWNLYDHLPQSTLNALCIGLLLLLLTDAVISATVLGKIRQSAALTGGDDTETLTRAVRAHLSEGNALIRRALVAFPTLKIYNSRLLNMMRDKKRQLRAEAKARKKALKDKLRQSRAE